MWSWEELCTRRNLTLLLSLIGVGLLVVGVFKPLGTTSIGKLAPSPTSSPSVSGSSTVLVDVSGAVNNPGVYPLQAGSRIGEALKVAGGVSAQVDPEYLSRYINLSQKITDGMKVYIPSKGESPPDVRSSGGKTSTIVDLNAASAEELDQLPGIGPTTSQSIIKNRPYVSVNDLLSKKVVSKSVFQKIKDLVSI